MYTDIAVLVAGERSHRVFRRAIIGGGVVDVHRAVAARHNDELGRNSETSKVSRRIQE
jgi:hypothetical protein